MDKLQEFLLNMDYETEAIREWITTTYKNHCFRNHIHPTRSELEHLKDFLNSDYAPKNLEGKPVGLILKSMEVWDKTTLNVDNSKVKEKVVFEKGDFLIFQLLSPEALMDEGNAMNHCIGKSSAYLEGLRTGSSTNFSLRKNGTRIATFEIQNQKSLNQIKGPFNNTVDVESTEVIIDFCNTKGFTDISFGLYAYNILSTGDKIVSYQNLQSFLDTTEYISSLKLGKEQGFIKIPKTLFVNKLQLTGGFFQFEDELNVGTLHAYGIHFTPPKIINAKSLSFSTCTFPSKIDSQFNSPSIRFAFCKLTSFPAGNYSHLEFMAKDEEPMVLELQGDYKAQTFEIHGVTLKGDYNISASTFFCADSQFEKNRVEISRSLKILSMPFYKLDKEYQNLSIRIVKSIKGFSQKVFNNLTLHRVSLKFLPVEKVNDLCIEGVLGMEIASTLEANSFKLRNSSVILPKTLVVKENFTIIDSSFESWPEKLEVFGDLYLEGKNFPPLTSGVVVHGKIYSHFSNLKPN